MPFCAQDADPHRLLFPKVLGQLAQVSGGIAREVKGGRERPSLPLLSRWPLQQHLRLLRGRGTGLPGFQVPWDSNPSAPIAAYGFVLVYMSGGLLASLVSVLLHPPLGSSAPASFIQPIS